MSFKGRHIVLGVTGGIAAYKACDIASRLRKKGASVHVIMTEHACEFVRPLTFETLTNEPVVTDMFHREKPWEVEHVSLAKLADLFIVAPATANIMAKTAAGIADDMLSTTILAASCPLLFAPAMNSAMWLNPATQRNLSVLKDLGVSFVGPASGNLACGDQGIGRMSEPEDIVFNAEMMITEKDLSGLKIVVTAGPTREMLDPVRFLSNRSTGKMGYAIAERAFMRGAEVTLISGPSALTVPDGIRVISVLSSEDLRKAAVSESRKADIFIQAAAPADYTPETYSEQKIKKTDDEMFLKLKRTEDIAAACGAEKRSDQVFIGFAAETEHLFDNALGKLTKKNLDLIALNDVSRTDAGFEVDHNQLTLIGKDLRSELPLLTKKDAADELLNAARKCHESKNAQ